MASSDVDSGDTESGLLTVVGTRPQLALPAQPTRSEEENIFYVSINISSQTGAGGCWGGAGVSPGGGRACTHRQLVQGQRPCRQVKIFCHY